MRIVDNFVDNLGEQRQMDLEISGERLSKFLANAGVASRRHAEDLITAGAVTVNGTVISNLGTRVDPMRDQIAVNGQAVGAVTTTTTIAINKPEGYVSTAQDPQGRPIVADLLPEELRSLRLVPVGRLDFDSEGLILLSNDGDLALKLTHPRYETEKEYHALVQGALDDDALQILRDGIVLVGDEPRPTAPASIWRVLDRYPEPPVGQQWIGVIIHEGRKRQVRQMFSAVGTKVIRLVRVRIGNLHLANVVPELGMTHILTPDEVALTLSKGRALPKLKVAAKDRPTAKGRAGVNGRSAPNARNAPRGRSAPRGR